MSPNLIIKRDETKAFRKLIDELSGAQVLVGVPSDDEQPHRAVGTIGPNARIGGVEVNNAELAYLHDNGVPEKNVPARPFMIPGMELVKDATEAHLKTAAVGLLSDDHTLFELEMNQAGIAAVDGIRKIIEAGVPPPLSERTLANRRARGVTGTTPLIDTHQLFNSISYVIRTDAKHV